MTAKNCFGTELTAAEIDALGHNTYMEELMILVLIKQLFYSGLLGIQRL